MVETQRFVVGPVVTGSSFIGRSKEIHELSQSIFGGVGAINLIGPPRIGKTSLVSEVFLQNRACENRLTVFFSMGDCEDLFDFWYTFWAELRNSMEDSGLWGKIFEQKYKELDQLDGCTPHWFTKAKGAIRRILESIGKKGFRLVLGIDEFDSASRLFENKAEHYQLLRSIFSEPGWSTSGVIISRRRLGMFEAQCPYISTFHGVFREVPLRAFSDEDMEEFYIILSVCNIKLEPDGKRRISYYTGNIPYLCAMFGSWMENHNCNGLPVGKSEIDSIFMACAPQIDTHYKSLIDRLREDDHLEFMFYLSIGAKPPAVAERHYQNMLTMGTLTQDSGQYYAYTKDFMTYLRLQPLKLPAWETLTAAEKKLRSFIAAEYPGLGKITYHDMKNDLGKVKADVKSQYPELYAYFEQQGGKSWGNFLRDCASLAAHKPNPSVLDVITLSNSIFYIDRFWASNFSKYFNGDTSWMDKLKQIKKLRNPMAHAQIEYVDSAELALCLKYCDELVHL